MRNIDSMESTESTSVSIVTELPTIEERFAWNAGIPFKQSCLAAELTLANGKKEASLSAHEDEKANLWEMIYEKEESSNSGILSIQVTRPRFGAFEEGLKPTAMKMNILLTRGTEESHFGIIETDVMCIHAGYTKRWTIGPVAEILIVLMGEQLKVEVVMEHFDYTFVMKEVNEEAEEKSALARLGLMKKPKYDVLSSVGDLMEEGSNVLFDFQMEVTGKVFYLHKAILTVRCPFFEKMVLKGYPDSTLAEKMSLGLSKRTMEILLRFVYTGKLDLKPEESLETFEELLPAINKWEIFRLLNLVDLKMIDCATVESAERLFELASIYQLINAVSDLSVFIARNRRAVFDARREKRAAELRSSSFKRSSP